MVDLAPQATVPADTTARPSIRRYYVLALLTVIYALNFLDRTIFNVLIEPIKKEFALSDTTMGLLAGFGFVLFYSLLGIPIARLADRFNRRNIVAIALAFWSAMTVFCGMAQSVTTLALARRKAPSKRCRTFIRPSSRRSPRQPSPANPSRPCKPRVSCRRSPRRSTPTITTWKRRRPRRTDRPLLRQR